MASLLKEVTELTTSLKEDVASLITRAPSSSSSSSLRSMVGAHHILAGREVLAHFDSVRVAQEASHKRNLEGHKRVHEQWVVAGRELSAWMDVAAAATRMEECVVHIEQETQKAVLALHRIVEMLAPLETLLTQQSAARDAAVVRQWQEAQLVAVEREREALEVQYTERVRSALQAAFEQQLRKYKEDPAAFVAVPSVAGVGAIEQVQLDGDAADEEALEKLFAADEGENAVVDDVDDDGGGGGGGGEDER